MIYTHVLRHVHAESAAHWTRHDAYPLRRPHAISHDTLQITIEALSIYMSGGRKAVCRRCTRGTNYLPSHRVSGKLHTVRLFKYLVPARTDVLVKRRIRFTQAADFNDPFEIAPHVTSILAGDPPHGTSREAARRILQDALRREAELYGLLPQFELLQQTILNPESDVDVFAMIRELEPFLLEQIRPTFGVDFQTWFGDRFGILSLSEVPTSLLMWAHYANSHTGIVLEFESDHAFFHQRTMLPVFGAIRRVEYSFERPAIRVYDPSATSVDEQIERIAAQLLLTKGKEWEYEREWRMILPLMNTDHHPHIVAGRIHLFDIPAEAITAVILGARASAETREIVEDLVHSASDLHHIVVRQARISPTTYHVHIEQ